MHGLKKKEEFVRGRTRELMADRLAWELGINPQAGKKILNW